MLMIIYLTYQFINVKDVHVLSDQHIISSTSSFTLTTLSLEERTTKGLRLKTSDIRKDLYRGVQLYPHGDEGRTSIPMLR
jgi:hypothetical protein